MCEAAVGPFVSHDLSCQISYGTYRSSGYLCRFAKSARVLRSSWHLSITGFLCMLSFTFRKARAVEILETIVEILSSLGMFADYAGSNSCLNIRQYFTWRL